MEVSEKKSVSVRMQRMRYVASDYAAGCLAFFLFNIYRSCILPNQGGDVWHYVFSQKLLAETFAIPLLMLAVYWMSGFYNLPFGKSRLQELITTFCSSLINTALIYLALLINDQTGHRIVNYEMIVMLLCLLFASAYVCRLWITVNARRRFREHKWEFRVLIVGTGKAAREAAARLVEGPSRVGYKVAGFIRIPEEGDAEPDGIAGGVNIFTLAEIKEICSRLAIDQVIIVQKSYSDKVVLDIVNILFPLDIPIKILPDTLSFITPTIRLKDIYGEPFVDLTSPDLSESSKNVKRLADIVVSALMLLLLSPLLAWLWVMVKRSSPGPVIYGQERLGLRQKPFTIYKFRTMVCDAEKGGPMLSEPGDSRITRIGHTLRKYRLDELPQFWNVIKGDMSLVGPRPERAYFIQQIMRHAPYYALVFQVRPGITSWGMVKFGYASNIAQMVARTRYDLIYITNMSLFVDIKILIYTVKTVITGQGI